MDGVAALCGESGARSQKLEAALFGFFGGFFRGEEGGDLGWLPTSQYAHLFDGQSWDLTSARVCVGGFWQERASS